MVAAVCGWHEWHDRSAREIQERLDAGQTLIIGAPALAETFAVLTRLPPPHRVSPHVAAQLIDANFMRANLDIVSLGVDHFVDLIRTAPQRGIAGGRVYDAVILSCAMAAGASALLTFNERHFRSLAHSDIEIVVPS